MRGRPLVIPERCACCGQAPSSEIPAAAGKNADKVARTQAAAWRFPICAQCAHHAARWRTARVFTRWFQIGGPGLVLLLTMAGGGAAVFFIGGAAACGLAALAGYLGRREALALCHVGCASPGPPVVYLGSYDNIDSFEFLQKGYAVNFMRANLRRLAPQSSEAQSLIQPDLDRVATVEGREKSHRTRCGGREDGART